MGVRKRKSAEELKETRRQVAFAKLNNCPTSPRKMRLMANLIRGERGRKGPFSTQIQLKRVISTIGKAIAIGSSQLAS